MTPRRPEPTPAHRTADREGGITFLIPHWHHRWYLSRSVRSCIAAVRRLRAAGIGAEIIVVDDNSRDGAQRFLAAIVALYRDVSIRAVFRDSTKGVAANRNLGAALSRHRYCCMVDADNTVSADNIADIYAAAGATQAAATYGNLVVCRADGRTRLVSNDLIGAGLFQRNYIDTMMLIETECILRFGGYNEDPGVNGLEDWDMLAHLFSENRRIVFVPLVFGYYYEEPGSLVQQAARMTMERRYHQREQPLGVQNTQHFMYHPVTGLLIRAAYERQSEQWIHTFPQG